MESTALKRPLGASDQAQRPSSKRGRTTNEESLDLDAPEPPTPFVFRCSLLGLTHELQAQVFRFCDGTALARAEQACVAFRGPRQPQSPIQEASRYRLAAQFGPQARLRIQSEPALLSKMEALAMQAAAPDSSSVHDLVFGQSAFNLLHQQGLKQLLATDHGHILTVYLTAQLGPLRAAAAAAQADAISSTSKIKFAFSALRELAHEHAAARGMIAGGVLPLLSELTGHPVSEHTRRAAAEVIGSIAEHESLVAPIVRAGVLPGLVQLLDVDAAAGVHLAAIRVLNRLAVQQSSVAAMLDCGAVKGLLQAMSADAVVRVANAAANTLSRVFTYASTSDMEAIVAAGAVTVLTQQVRSGGRVSQRCSALMLAQITKDENYLALVTSAGAPAALLTLLSGGTAELQQAAAHALRNLCSHDSSCVAVLTAGGLKAFTRALRTASEQVQKSTALAIGYLAHSAPEQMDTPLGSLVQRLGHLVIEGSHGVRHAAVFALSALTNHPRHALKLKEVADITSTLVQQLAAGLEDDFIRRRVVKLLTRLVVLPGQELPFSQAGGVPLLLQQLLPLSKAEPASDTTDQPGSQPGSLDPGAVAIAMFTAICVTSAMSAVDIEALVPAVPLLAELITSNDPVAQYAGARVALRLPAVHRAPLLPQLTAVTTKDWRLQQCRSRLLGQQWEPTSVGCPWCGHALIEMQHSVSLNTWLGCDVGLAWLPLGVTTMDCSHGCDFNCCVTCWKRAIAEGVQQQPT